MESFHGSVDLSDVPIDDVKKILDKPSRWDKVSIKNKCSKSIHFFECQLLRTPVVTKITFPVYSQQVL